jgi:hypothetical protein
MHSGRNFDALVGMDSLSKAVFHWTLLKHPKYTQAYLDHAHNIVHDFCKCDIRFLHEIDPKEGGAVQDAQEKKDGKPDPTKEPVDIGSPDSIRTDSPSKEMVTGFPPSPDEMVYVEDNCMKYVHASGPVDIGCDFAAIDELVLSNLTRSSFQCTEYFDLIHDFSIFFDKWLTVDTVQFYQCWVSRSIGSYPKNILLFPLDYYQADVEDIFEDYWSGIQPSFKKNFVMHMWRYVHPASYLRYKINIRKKKSGVTYPHTDLSLAAPWDFDIFKGKIPKIFETLTPTTSTLKRRKVSPSRGVKKTKGGTGRRQTPTDSDDEEDPIVTPYKWSTSTTRVKQTKGGPIMISTRATAVTAGTDSVANSSESEDKEGDSVEVVKKITKNTGDNLTPAALGGQLQINRHDTAGTLQESVAKLHAQNQMLARQIRNVTKIGGVDKYELMQIRKMVQEDLFKRVKFITSTAMEEKCMKYLSNKLNVPAERQHEWSASYAHCVREALNNKRNNVSQDLKAEIKGKK